MGIFRDFFNFLDSWGGEAESRASSHDEYIASSHIWLGPSVFEPAPPEGIAWKEDE